MCLSLNHLSLNTSPVIRLCRQSRPPLDQLDNRIDLRIAQRRDITLRRLAGDRINLDQLELATSHGDLVQPLAKCFQLGLPWRLARNSHEQSLNHQRPDLRSGRDVLEDLLKRNRRAIDELEVLLG